MLLQLYLQFQPTLMQALRSLLAATFLLKLGAFSFGLLVGWFSYRTRAGKNKQSRSDLLTVSWVLAAGFLFALTKSSELFSSYAIGLVVGFFLDYLSKSAGTGENYNPSWIGTAGGSVVGIEITARSGREITIHGGDVPIVDYDYLLNYHEDRTAYLGEEFLKEEEQQQQQLQQQQSDDETTAPARYVNVSLRQSTDNKSSLPPTMNLNAEKQYVLTLDIGDPSPDSVVTNAEDFPFPDQRLPKTENGHWLEVVAVSDDFSVSDANGQARNRYHLFLPNVGESWVCSCLPGENHLCTPVSRDPHLFIWLKPRVQLKPEERVRAARVRIGVYYEKNLVQSQLLTAHIAKEEGEGEGYNSFIDYTLTSDLADVSFLPEPRTLNILTNQNEDGTHKVVVNGQEGDAKHFNISEGQMGNAIGAVRQALVDVHVVDEGGGPPNPPKWKNLYDKNNGKTKDKFIADLNRTAYLGWLLWTELMGADADLQTTMRNTLKAPSSIQVSRVSGSAFIFPWAMIYDIPLEYDKDYTSYKPCRLLDEWNNAATLVADAFCCPYESTHKLNVICPFGFWGFRHTIEQPPSMPKGRKLPVKITIGNQPPEIMMGVSRRLDAGMEKDHIADVKKRLPTFTVDVKDSLATIKTALEDAKLEIIYFYCHGRRKLLQGSARPIPLLEVGDSEFFAPSDLPAWNLGWDANHWRETSPLVFINGCNTAELTPDLLVNFVDNFFGQYASGVIGTEVMLDQSVAGEAAAEFFQYFQGQNVGRALQLMRRTFLLKGNLLGLAYTPYCSSALSLGN